MPEIGDKEEKPWSRETTRQRYVQGSTIGLRGLAKLSGVPFGALKNWSKGDCQDPEGRTWPEQREQWIHSLRTKTNEKTLELVSDAIADSNLELVKIHLEAWKNQREIPSEFNKLLKKYIECLKAKTTLPQEEADALKVLITLGGKAPISAYTGALGNAIAGERIAANLDIVRIEVLEKEAGKHGLSLVDLNELPGLAE